VGSPSTFKNNKSRKFKKKFGDSKTGEGESIRKYYRPSLFSTTNNLKVASLAGVRLCFLTSTCKFPVEQVEFVFDLGDLLVVASKVTGVRASNRQTIVAPTVRLCLHS
jgi:hypothetical protein